MWKIAKNLTYYFSFFFFRKKKELGEKESNEKLNFFIAISHYVYNNFNNVCVNRLYIIRHI